MVQRTYTDLILCDDSTDSLLLEQAADESLRITLRHDPTVGNLNVTIERMKQKISVPPTTCTGLRSSRSSSRVETVS